MIAVAAGIALGGCGGAHKVGQAAAPSTDGADPSTASSTPVSVLPGSDALTSYQGMWEDWVAIATTSDYENPRLTRHVSGEALSIIYRAVAADRHKGLVSKGQPILAPHVAAVTPTEMPSRVTIDDCVDDSRWLQYEETSGRLDDDVPGGRHRVQALVVKSAGEWKVDKLVIQSVGTC